MRQIVFEHNFHQAYVERFVQQIVVASGNHASCERVFDASIKHKPVVVLSNNDGCVVARSEEAKQIGVTMGSPLFKVHALLEENDSAIFSSNYALYGDMSGRVMNLLHNFTPEVEIYSIDEAFLSLEPRKNSLEKLAYSIREKMYKWTGIPVSIGIAETKVLAKIANKRAKSAELREKGVLNLYRSIAIEPILKETKVDEVWGIGYRSLLKLKAQNILTAWQLRETDNRFIRRLLTVVGARIALELRGIKCLPFEQFSQKKHTITCSRSFGRTVTSYEDVKTATLYFLTRACERMRQNNLAAQAVTVFISTDRCLSLIQIRQPTARPIRPTATRKFRNGLVKRWREFIKQASITGKRE